ncbi:ABC transporter substrate-binding protein [Paenibacillus sp. 11B]|uniref:ABC transporter substrate-binding protein n=1 Tax=unclassified Paenibacillus TaxID=185978 RepID=UPI00264F4750|nr:ABC transporter substrate-binding protein [Paenibacillus sp. 11B]MDN8589252.1 ABC transporter substrate-binding protein [Paenibacillus sp. 11B]
MDTTTTHYVRLATAKELSLTLDEPVPVTIDSLSDALCCTPRNVKFILRKLEEQGFIHWQPGRGRGHYSEMTLLRSVNETLENHLRELIGRGKIKEAIELISTIDIHKTLQEQLLRSLNKHMGFHSHAETASGQDVLRMMRSRRQGNLDPAFVYTAFETYLLGQVGNTLVTYDAKSNSFQPDLAHMWECSEDHTVWIFYLRKGVRFHHGRVMTSKDVQATLQRLHDVHSPSIWLYRDIERAEITGDYCIRFELSRPNRFFLHLFSCIRMTILPYDMGVSERLIGTGPFQITKMNEDVLELGAFEAYYGIRPHLDQVHIWFVPDLGPNDRYYELPGTSRLKLPSTDFNTNSINYPALGCQYMLFNFRKEGIHHHPKFRQALRMVYDSVALVKDLGGNRITPAGSFLPWKSEILDWTESSLEHTCELLHSSGYQGETIALSYTLNKDSKAAEWLQRRAQVIGLRLAMCPCEDNIHFGETMNAELIMAEEILEGDWQYGMIHFFKNLSNHFHMCMTPDLQSILDQKLDQFAQLPSIERAELLDEAEEMLRENNWILHGCHMNKRAQLDQSIFGMQTAEFGYMDISQLWIKISSEVCFASKESP